MRNLGPKTLSWLKQAGIQTEQDIRSVGVIEVFLQLKDMGFRPSLNALWALEGACEGIDWRDIPSERKLELKEELQRQLSSHEP
ncbi:TfoX/Sxy family protein [Deinococcus cellulosilyticus]|nr:TfoX/Sxy family protein [Deinococcus cellulosilyticus]